MLGCKTPPKQKIRSLALQATLAENLLAESATHDIASILQPIAIESIKRGFHCLTIEAMRGQLRSDTDRAVTIAGSGAEQTGGEASVVLPTIARQFFDGVLRVIGFNAARSQFARQFFF